MRRRARGQTGLRKDGPRMREEEGMEQMERALHELCQPLTPPQCGLEVAGLTGTPEAFREAVEIGMTQCARLAEVVGSPQTAGNRSRRGRRP